MGAGHLKIGDRIKQADGTTGLVANVTTVQQTREMFNLTVSEAHTYYVGQDGWLVHNCNGVNIDTGAAFALISEGSAGRGAIKASIGSQPMYMTQTALAEFTNAVSKIGGPLEKARAEALMKRVTIIPDNMSSRAAALNTTRALGANDRTIFGTADSLGLTTIITDAKFLRASNAQGVQFNAILHPPVPLTGR